MNKTESIKNKVKTWRFYYEGKDDFSSINFCSTDLDEAEELFNTFCDENDYDHNYESVEMVWDECDALVEENYWTFEESMRYSNE